MINQSKSILIITLLICSMSFCLSRIVPISIDPSTDPSIDPTRPDPLEGVYLETETHSDTDPDADADINSISMPDASITANLTLDPISLMILPRKNVDANTNSFSNNDGLRSSNNGGFGGLSSNTGGFRGGSSSSNGGFRGGSSSNTGGSTSSSTIDISVCSNGDWSACSATFSYIAGGFISSFFSFQNHGTVTILNRICDVSVKRRISHWKIVNDGRVSCPFGKSSEARGYKKARDAAHEALKQFYQINAAVIQTMAMNTVG